MARAELALAEQYAPMKTKQRMFGEFQYAAGTWNRQRRVIARLEHGEQGADPRFIVTDLPGSPKALYERRYCARGEAENRIKEAQLDLFGRRASCHRYQANQIKHHRIHSLEIRARPKSRPSISATALTQPVLHKLDGAGLRGPTSADSLHPTVDMVVADHSKPGAGQPLAAGLGRSRSGCMPSRENVTGCGVPGSRLRQAAPAQGGQTRQ